MKADLAEMRLLRSELLDAHRELVHLRSRTEQLVAANHDLSGLLGTSAHRLAELVKVIVAFQRLLDAQDVTAAWGALEDILVNVIGTEDFVILQLTPTDALRPVGGRGAALARALEDPGTLEDVRHAGARGRIIPLHIGENVVGVVAITELLPHRAPLNAGDDQVLTLISRFAASAVMLAEQHRAWVRLTPPSAW